MAPKKPKIEKKKYLESESGYIQKEWRDRLSMVLVYPNTYRVGMSNLGLHILYREMNFMENALCERAFLADVQKEEPTPVRSLETGSSLREFDIVAFCLSFEIDGFNMVEMLKCSDVTVKAEERSESEPLVIMGGPCPTFNSEPWAPFMDGIVIGEGEEILKEIAENWKNSAGQSRKERIRKLSEIEGFYLPSLYEPQYDGDRYLGLKAKEDYTPKLPICKRGIDDISKYAGYTEVISPETEFGHMFLIEVARGCGRHCRFCMAGYAFRNPRVRSVEEILSAIEIGKERGAKQIGLVGAAVSDHPQIDALCRAVDEAGLDMSVASLRADNVSETLLKKLVKSGQRTVTFAPETGSERMRKVINKGLDENDLLNAAGLALKTGMKNIRLYAMLGLPSERDEDVEAMVELARKIRKLMKENHQAGKVILSVNPFIPKPFTPFEKMPVFNGKEIEAKIRYLQKELPLREGYEVKAESLRESWVQAILARGDRRLADVMISCGDRGWREFAMALKRSDLKIEQYEYQTIDHWPSLPWEHLNLGVTQEYFEEERQKAFLEQETIPCFDGCKRCGACK